MLRALVVPMAALSLAVAACGESEEEEFRNAYEPVNEALSDLGGDVRDALQDAESKSDAQIAREFDAFADSLAEIGADFEELEAPGEAEEVAARLERAMRDVENALRDIATAARNHSSSAKRTAALDLLQEGERLDALQQKLVDTVGG